MRAYRVIVDHLLQALSKLCETGLFKEKKTDRERMSTQDKKKDNKKTRSVLKQGYTNNKMRLNANFYCTLHDKQDKLFSQTGITDTVSVVWRHNNTLGKNSLG